MSLYYGANAPNTGLCLISLSISTTGVISSVGICQGGSHEYVGYLNASDPLQSGICNWTYESPSTEYICLETPLTGTIGHDGDTYSIYDATSTLPLIYTTITFPGFDYQYTQVPALLVNPYSTEYQYFFTDVGYGTQSLSLDSATVPPLGTLSSLPALTLGSGSTTSLTPAPSSTSSMAPDGPTPLQTTPPSTTSTTASSTGSSMPTDSPISLHSTSPIHTNPATHTVIPTQASSDALSLKWPFSSTVQVCVLAVFWLYVGL